MPVHHLMIGTWTPPGAIFTVAFDDEKLTLTLVKRTEIPHDEPISWMSFDVGRRPVWFASADAQRCSTPRGISMARR
jgi:carboxy-cis,cis-muconate cyclase